MSKTYILVGHDHNGAWGNAVDTFDAYVKQHGSNSDIVVLKADEGQTLAELASKIKEKPANIILFAHGGSVGTFEWEKGSSYSYVSFMAALPKEGIESVTIGGCYGETGIALNILAKAPPGAIVQASNGAKVMGWGTDATEFAQDITRRKEFTPLSIILESLDVVDPNDWNKKGQREHNEQKKTTPYIGVNPDDVLPHTIGIGGNPPIILNLNEEMGKLKGADLSLAVNKLNQHFDVKFQDESNWSGVSSQYELSNKIAVVAEKLEKGVKLTDDEKRIGYGLTVAYLHQSGEIDRMIAKAAPEEAFARTKQGQSIKDLKDLLFSLDKEQTMTQTVQDQFGRVFQQEFKAKNGLLDDNEMVVFKEKEVLAKLNVDGDEKLTRHDIEVLTSTVSTTTSTRSSVAARCYENDDSKIWPTRFVSAIGCCGGSALTDG